MKEITNLTQAINSLVATKQGESDADKIQIFQLAKEVVNSVKEAKRELATVADKDSLALSIGLEFIRVLGAE